MDQQHYEKSSRREFVQKTGMALASLALAPEALGASHYRNAAGANDRVRVGFIGVGNRGSQLLNLFMPHADCEVAALCDVYEPYTTRNRSQVDPRYLSDRDGQIPKMGEKFARKPKLYKDYRKLLEDKSIDAVVIATPDHWHCLQTIHAIGAGKDVYVEKPLTITIAEGRQMVNAQAASNQVVAVGLNRRGAAVYQKLAGEVPEGKIGKVTVARAYRINNLSPNGIGKMQPEPPPANFDWDMWLGPRAQRPYQYNIAPYMFRWWSDYSSQMGNWGVHFLDVIRWMLGEQAPVAISAHGGKFALDHDGDIPDTMQVTYEFASGALASFCIYEASSGALFSEGEVELRGTKGTLYASEGGYKVFPTGNGQFQSGGPQLEKEEFSAKNAMLADGSSGDSTATLVRNFLDCVKSRQKPTSDIETCVRSSVTCILANVAMRSKMRITWDEKAWTVAEKEARPLLKSNYRRPWKLEV